MIEREKIVAWLERDAEAREKLAAGCRDMTARYHNESRAMELRSVARRIQAGEHLKRPEPTIPATEWLPNPSVGHG